MLKIYVFRHFLKKSQENIWLCEKLSLPLHPLSWKQSYLPLMEKTNTYWRYRAIVCEDSRFIRLYPLIISQLSRQSMVKYS